MDPKRAGLLGRQLSSDVLIRVPTSCKYLKIFPKVYVMITVNSEYIAIQKSAKKKKKKQKQEKQEQREQQQQNNT